MSLQVYVRPTCPSSSLKPVYEPFHASTPSDSSSKASLPLELCETVNSLIILSLL